MIDVVHKLNKKSVLGQGVHSTCLYLYLTNKNNSNNYLTILPAYNITGNYTYCINIFFIRDTANNLLKLCPSKMPDLFHTYFVHYLLHVYKFLVNIPISFCKICKKKTQRKQNKTKQNIP